MENLRRRNKREETAKAAAFTCPGDGKWPDETDCGKFHNCQGASETGGWCGPGMSFDTDNQRCEMALAINCKDGDRPDWKPPDNWSGKLKMTTTTTKKAVATTKKSENSDGKDDSEANVIVATTKSIKENDACIFKGLMPDIENCQSYFYCKDSVVNKQLCPDRQLFDDETKGCKEFKDVYCGDRPVNDKGQDQCRLRPNGVYPNLENGCSDFYQCSNQKKTKSGECPQGLKFNLLTLRCDWPGNVPVPCGSKRASNSGTVNSLNSLFGICVIIINTLIATQ